MEGSLGKAGTSLLAMQPVPGRGQIESAIGCAHPIRKLAAVQHLLLPGAAVIGAVGCLLDAIEVPQHAATRMHKSAMMAAGALECL